MRALWDTVVAPLVEAASPATVLDTGGDEELAGLIAGALARDGGELVRDLETGPEGAAPAMAVVHGNPNWHAVTDALERLDEMASADDAAYPVTLVHGVDWPTGRRDSYPDPAAVPVGARQPHAAEAGVERALDAHGARNGVLTAVEDFVEGSERDLDLIHVPGLGGIAIVVDERRLRGPGSRSLRQALRRLRLDESALAQLAAVEAARARTDIEMEEMAAELEAARAGIAVQASAEREALQERVRDLAAKVAELQETLARREARLASLEGDGPARETPAALAGRAETSRAAAPADDLPEPLAWRHRLLSADELEETGVERLDAVVAAGEDAALLRACLWSLLARAGRRMTLTIVGGEGQAAGLARDLAAEEPRIRLAEEMPPPGDAWRLRVERPVVFGHGALENLLGAARKSPTAAVSTDALGVPSWAGAESVALLFGERVVGIDGAREIAAPCVAAPPGAADGEPEAVCLGAAVEANPGIASSSPPADLLEGAFATEAALTESLRRRLLEPLSIAYVLPGLPAEGSGGSHSVFQEAAALSWIGAQVRVLVEGEHADRAIRLYPAAADLVRSYGSRRELGEGLAGCDVAVATEAPSAPLVGDHAGGGAALGAYYIQDYEPLFNDAGGARSDAALLSYRRAERMLLFAKTHWVANAVSSAHGVPVAKVSPSLDRTLFHADGRVPRESPLRVIAMVRPRTPRRRPEETLAALARVARELDGSVECLSFGCTDEEREALPSAHGVEHIGVLTRREVAETMRGCDVFLDLSAYQAFGRTGLEAMACGAVPVLPIVGGAREYAVDDRNALLLDTTDEDAVVVAVTALAGDSGRLERLRRDGVESAQRFSAVQAAASQYACFAAELARLA